MSGGCGEVRYGLHYTPQGPAAVGLPLSQHPTHADPPLRGTDATAPRVLLPPPSSHPAKKNVRRLPPADTRHVRGRDKAGGTRRRPAIEPPASLPTTACCCLPCTVVPLDDASDHKQRPQRERYGTHTWRGVGTGRVGGREDQEIR